VTDVKTEPEGSAPVSAVADLMRATLFEVFNERDADRRRAAIARTYASDVRFADPDEAVTGHAAVEAKARRILDEAPGFVFSAAGPVLVNHDLGHLAWNFGPDGQPPVVRGMDIALVADGRITSLYTFLLTD
jgi:hypothetical protein